MSHDVIHGDLIAGLSTNCFKRVAECVESQPLAGTSASSVSFLNSFAIGLSLVSLYQLPPYLVMKIRFWSSSASGVFRILRTSANAAIVSGQSGQVRSTPVFGRG